MITETLTGQASYLPAVNFQTQLLKVVFTTLYVDVKEPAARIFQATKKTQLCLPTVNHVSVHQCRDKIEFNLQSQSIQEHTPSTFASGAPFAAGCRKYLSR